jgi:hypothetical protein
MRSNGIREDQITEVRASPINAGANWTCRSIHPTAGLR